MNSFSKYKELTILEAGRCFGELSLLNNSPRDATIIAKETSHFLTISNEDFQTQIKRKEKLYKEIMVEFFKNVPYFSFMSPNSLMRMEHLFKLQVFEVGGKNILREGDLVKNVVIVKDGEFEIVKRDLSDIDKGIMKFLQKSVVKSRMAKKILLLRGGSAIYSKSKQLFPAFKNN